MCSIFRWMPSRCFTEQIDFLVHALANPYGLPPTQRNEALESCGKEEGAP